MARNGSQKKKDRGYSLNLFLFGVILETYFFGSPEP